MLWAIISTWSHISFSSRSFFESSFKVPSNLARTGVAAVQIYFFLTLSEPGQQQHGWWWWMSKEWGGGFWIRLYHEEYKRKRQKKGQASLYNFNMFIRSHPLSAFFSELTLSLSLLSSCTDLGAVEKISFYKLISQGLQMGANLKGRFFKKLKFLVLLIKHI